MTCSLFLHAVYVGTIVVAHNYRLQSLLILLGNWIPFGYCCMKSTYTGYSM